MTVSDLNRTIDDIVRPTISSMTELITKLVAKLDYSYRRVLPRTNIVQVIFKEIEYPSQKFGVLKKKLVKAW